MSLQRRLPLIAVLGFATFCSAATAQDRPLGPGEWKNPLGGGGGLLGGGSTPGTGTGTTPGTGGGGTQGGGDKNSRRIENPKTARAILDSFKAGTGWTIAEVQTIDEKDGSCMVSYRKVIGTDALGDNGKEAVIVLTLGPPTPAVKLPGKGKDDGPTTSAIAALKARLAGLDKMIAVDTKEKKPTADLIAQKKLVQEALDALTK